MSHRQTEILAAIMTMGTASRAAELLGSLHLFGDSGDAWGDIVSKAGSGAAIGSLLPFVWVAFVVRLPAERAEAARERIDALEARLRPRIDLRFDGNTIPPNNEAAKGADGKSRWHLVVAVANVSGEGIRNVEVELQRIDYPQGPMTGLPRRLAFREGGASLAVLARGRTAYELRGEALSCGRQHLRRSVDVCARRLIVPLAANGRHDPRAGRGAPALASFLTRPRRSEALPKRFGA